MGEINSEMKIFADWLRENETGVIYYLDDGMVKGVMLCNVWDRVDLARELIRGRKRFTETELAGAIPFK